MRSHKRVVGAPKQEVVSIFLKKEQSMIGFTVHSGVQHYCNHAFTLTAPYICNTAHTGWHFHVKCHVQP